MNLPAIGQICRVHFEVFTHRQAEYMGLKLSPGSRHPLSDLLDMQPAKFLGMEDQLHTGLEIHPSTPYPRLVWECVSAPQVRFFSDDQAWEPIEAGAEEGQLPLL